MTQQIVDYTKLMAEAAEALRDPLDQAEIKAPGLRFVANVSGGVVTITLPKAQAARPRKIVIEGDD